MSSGADGGAGRGGTEPSRGSGAGQPTEIETEPGEDEPTEGEGGRQQMGSKKPPQELRGLTPYTFDLVRFILYFSKSAYKIMKNIKILFAENISTIESINKTTYTSFRTFSYNRKVSIFINSISKSTNITEKNLFTKIRRKCSHNKITVLSYLTNPKLYATLKAQEAVRVAHSASNIIWYVVGQLSAEPTTFFIAHF